MLEMKCKNFILIFFLLVLTPVMIKADKDEKPILEESDLPKEYFGVVITDMPFKE